MAPWLRNSASAPIALSHLLRSARVLPYIRSTNVCAPALCSSESCSTQIVDVPEDCVGYIMGKQGTTLRGMEDEWGTLMFFAKASATSRPTANRQTPKSAAPFALPLPQHA